jgi:sucrose-6-phosphate hydrolase SacC (GH32 family)
MTNLLVCLGLLRLVGMQAPDLPIADFEGRDYGAWTTTGTAFGSGPAQGTLPNQMPVSGYVGHGLVNSYHGGDGATGTLTSPKFTIARHYINFLIGGGKLPGIACINLLIEGRVVRTATSSNNSERLNWASWDVADLKDRTAWIEIVDRATGMWGHINVDEIAQSDTKQQVEIRTDELYHETYRPQFHFSAKRNWLNDPNGLVYYRGEYHLFFQHNPFGLVPDNMTWGHAVSPDLVHWTQLPNAIEPDRFGTIFSGSAVVDRNNTAGFQTGHEKALVAIYTAAGGASQASQGQPFTQCLAYSNDRGRTWTKYAGNPVLKHIVGGNRDPKVIWYAPTHRWIMALYLDGNDYGLFASPDLKTWTQLQRFTVPGCGECPDFFEMSVDGDRRHTRWVFTVASGRYLVGAFDGKTFTPEGPTRQVDYGGNYYAVQTYSDLPAHDGRRIQIAWMNGGSYPEMPFNQQMSFPCTLTLHTTPDGLRLYRWPVREISKLAERPYRVTDVPLEPGGNPLQGLRGDLWDVELDCAVQDATAVIFRLQGEEIRYQVREQTLTCLGHTAPLSLREGRLKLRILVDRTSLEVFGNDGQVSLTSCLAPGGSRPGPGFAVEGGGLKIHTLTATPLCSIWPPATPVH